MPPLLRYTQHLARKYVVGSAPVIGGDTERNMTNTVISGLGENHLHHQPRATISNEEQQY